MEDIPLLINVVFSTASIERVRIFELLIEHQGRLTTSIITASLNTSNNTAKRTMAEFNALGLVDLGDIKSQHGEPEKEMTLKDKFQWFLSDEFNTVRKNTPYYPNDDNNNTVRKNLVLDCINKEDKKRVGGSFPYSIQRLPVYYSEGHYPIRMRIEESDPNTDTDTEPNTQFQKPKIEISESELEQLKHDNSPDAKARVLKTLTESKPDPRPKFD